MSEEYTAYQARHLAMKFGESFYQECVAAIEASAAQGYLGVKVSRSLVKLLDADVDDQYDTRVFDLAAHKLTFDGFDCEKYIQTINDSIHLKISW